MEAKKKCNELFSGYTMVLLCSVFKLSRFLRETEKKCQEKKNSRTSCSGSVISENHCRYANLISNSENLVKSISPLHPQLKHGIVWAI